MTKGRNVRWYLRRAEELGLTVRWMSRLIRTHKRTALDRSTLYRALNGVTPGALTDDEWLQLDILLEIPERKIKESILHQLEDRIEKIRIAQARGRVSIEKQAKKAMDRANRARARARKVRAKAEAAMERRLKRVSAKKHAPAPLNPQ